MLYRPDLHARLTETAWDAEEVRRRVRELVAGAEEAYRPDALWPAHEWDSFHAEPPMKNLYVGAAGTIWALDSLRRGGHAEIDLDLAAASGRALELARQCPDYAGWSDWGLPATPAASLLEGETGMLLVTWRLEPSAEIADDLHALVHANLGNDVNELMWGEPGTMLAAHAMSTWTDEPRWADAWHASAARLLAGRDEDGLWTQRLYGSEFRGLGVPHGFAGIARVLALGGEPLHDAGDVARRTAVVEEGLVNWPGNADSGLEAGDPEIKLQWCDGAPGMIVALAADLDDDLLLGAAETIWRAGPSGDSKGAGICHGTAGNGFALLKVFERTGDELWLERARRFAMHALEQASRLPPRYSLFTGGMGTAIFAARCLEERADYPTLDSWD